MLRLLAQSLTTPLDVYASWASLGANGIVSGLLVWIITRWIPAMRQDEHKVMRELVEAFREEREADRQSRHATNNKFNETIGKLHDTNGSHVEKLSGALAAQAVATEKVCKYPTLAVAGTKP